MADTYGTCFLPDLMSPTATDSSQPPPGSTHWYLVTGENLVGEGPMGYNSFFEERPNSSQCP